MGGYRVILGKKLVVGNDQPSIDSAAIIIHNKRIVAVGARKDVDIPVDAEVVDAGDATLVPGLIDTHLHLGAPNSGDHKNTDLAHYLRSPSQMLLDAVRNARIVLGAGITTVRDFDWISPAGNFNEELVSLKESIQKRKIYGPRMVVGGFTHTTHSHFDKVISRSARRDESASANGPWDMRRLARQNLRNGCDWLKTTISGGSPAFDPYDDYWDVNITPEELQAICDEAHNFRRKVAAHCHTPQSVRMAIAAGVDTIEHCVFTEDGVPELLAESGKYCVPTLSVRERRMTDARRARGMAEEAIQRRERMSENCFATFRAYRAAGVKFAMGTDTCVDPAFGESAREIGIYADLGMSPLEALQTATRNAADALGLLDDLGTLEVGKFADIVAVDADPLEDIWSLSEKDKIKLVVKDGDIVADRRDGDDKYLSLFV